ncbi:MAG: hypothetical protein Q9214_001705 [Letrouitia sp. 1 TL-2023]
MPRDGFPAFGTILALNSVISFYIRIAIGKMAQSLGSTSLEIEPLSSSTSQLELLNKIQQTLISVQQDHRKLSAAVDSINGRLDLLNNPEKTAEAVRTVHMSVNDNPDVTKDIFPPGAFPITVNHAESHVSAGKFSSSNGNHNNTDQELFQTPQKHSLNTLSGTSSRIILTTYPGQSGIDPLPMFWGHPDPLKRGPVVVSRNHSTFRRRNAIGAHGGSYAIYHALAVASNEVTVDHKPDFTNTEPAASIGPFPQWADARKIVSLDPFGHLEPWLFADVIRSENVHVRPTIAITKAHMRLPELEQSVLSGRLAVDGKICLNSAGELAVTKFAVEPVWYLPGVADRFGIDEGSLRRSLFEITGGSFPELITRGDIKLFLPPIGGLTVYCFGDPAKMSDPNVRIALRVHDECNGSDVFGSDICTCRPYLIFGVEEAVKEAQQGGSGVVIYFRKEGRALGEVTKYLVYNARAALAWYNEDRSDA